uniref:hypothetical protein n=1 Tax=Aeromonas enteropelogenes TaxID=29489 RepID=UPI001C885F7A
MMVDLKVMAYFKTSLSTRNWDSAIKKPRSVSGVFGVGCLAVSYSRMANATLPSALQRFTSEFGMGSGG